MGDKNFMGGLLAGLGQSLQQQQQANVENEFKKSLIEQNKLHGKLFEAQVKQADLKQQMQNSLMDMVRGGLGGGPGGDVGVIPQPQGVPQPQPGMAAMPQAEFPGREVAPPSGSPFTGSIEIPPGNLSYKNNNPGNLRFVGQPGASPGQGGFASFPSPEEGYAALQRQIEIDKGRNLSLGQFITKYAPPFENDTSGYIRNVSTKLGVDANVPLTSIPTDKIAPVIAWQESSTKVGLPQMLAQEQISQQMKSPEPQRSDRVSISQMPIGKRVALDVMFKQGFDLDTKFRDNQTEIKGNPEVGYNIFDKQDGTLLKTLPGVGRVEMVETTDASGAKTRVPVRVPASIGPGMGNAGVAGAGIPTAPPAYSYQEVKKPSGAVERVAVPQAQPGFGYQEAPAKAETTGQQGIPVADVGRTNMILHAQSKLGELLPMVLPKGEVNRELLFKAKAPFGGIGEGSTFYSKMYQAVDAALRLETGAQANEDEIKVKMREYWPNPQDTDKVVKQKMGDLNQYISRVVGLHDPTGQLRSLGEKATGPSAPVSPAPLSPSSGPPVGAKPTGKTVNGKPVYVLPDGRGWMP